MIAIIACGSDKVQKIADIVTGLGYDNKVFIMEDICRVWWPCGEDFEKYDAIIISGSPTTIVKENKQKYIDIFSFVWETNTPILGICFGHQLLGHYFGSQYTIGDMIDGPNKIELVNRGEALFHKIHRKIFHENHEEEISLPRDFILLGYSNSCKNEAMKHKDKDIYGVQFHPELSWVAGKKIIENFLNIIN